MLLAALLSAAAGPALAQVPAAGGQPGPAAAAALPLARLEGRRAWTFVDPGGTTSFPFRLQNLTRTSRLFTPRAALPEAWRLLTAESPFELPASRSDIRILSVAVPRDAAPGEYRIGYELASGSHVLRDSVRVFVRERRELALELLDAPRFALARETYDARFALRNRGNAPLRVRLSVRSSHGLAARPEPEAVDIGAHQTREITVRVATTPAPDRALSHQVELHAAAAGDEATAAVASASVEVIPRAATTGLPAHHLPFALRLRAAEPWGAAAPLEFAGGGPLRAGGTGRLDLLLRAPTERHSVMAERDEYRLGYHGERLDVRLGDQHFQASPLTDAGNYGFGAGARLRLGGWLLGAYDQRNRIHGAEAQRGASLGIPLLGLGRLEAHVAEREGPIAGRLGTARLSTAPVAGSVLDVELGSGEQGGREALARNLELRRSGQRVSFLVRHIDAGRGFPGVYRGMTYTHGDLVLQPVGRLQLRGSVNQHERDYGPGAGSQASTSAHAGVGWGGVGSVTLGREEWSSEFNGWVADREAELIRVRLSPRLGPLTLQPWAELGRTTDHRTGEESPFHDVSLQLNLRLGGSSMALSAGHFAGQTLYRELEQEGVSAGISVSARLGVRTSLRAAARATRTTGGWSGRSGLVDATLEHELWYGHRLAARTRLIEYTGATEFRESVFTLDYVVPFRLPVGRVGDVAEVVGRVYDAETGRALEGVLVRLGSRSAISGRDGSVVFTGLSPGVHHLSYDRLTAGLHRVGTVPMPLTVQAEAGETTRVGIGLARAGRISGSVRLLGYREGSGFLGGELVDQSGLRHVLVEIQSGELRQRRLTDPDGDFEFEDLPPGRWTVRIAAADLPENHQFDAESFELELAPAGSAEAEFVVRPRARRLRMIPPEPTG